MRYKRNIKVEIIQWCIVVGIILAAAFVASRLGKSNEKQAVTAESLKYGDEDGAVRKLGGEPGGSDSVSYGVSDVKRGSVKYSGSELTGLTIVLDAGHGGKDDGTSAMGSTEKDINIGVEKKIAELLESCGAEIIETRSDDTFISLKDRVELANNSGADLFVSVHCNYYEDDSSMNGFQCFYGGGSVYGEALANNITAAVEDKGICGTKHARSENYFVVCNTTMTSVLMELGYMSNREECLKLFDSEYQGELAAGIVKGIIDWYGDMEK